MISDERLQELEKWYSYDKHGAFMEVLPELRRLKQENAAMREALDWYAHWDWSAKYVEAIPSKAKAVLAKLDAEDKPC